jgi:hypothetical protein
MSIRCNVNTVKANAEKSKIKKRKYNRYLKFYDFHSRCFCECLYFKDNIDPKTGHKKNCKFINKEIKQTNS